MMKGKNIVLVGIIALVLVGFVLIGMSGLVGQSVVGGQASKLDCQNYVKNYMCIKTSTSPELACTDCSLQSLGYSVIIGGKSYSSVWRADCVPRSQVKDSVHTFCGVSSVAPVTPSPSSGTSLGAVCIDSKTLCSNGIRNSAGTFCDLGASTVTCSNGCSNNVCLPSSCANECSLVGDIKCQNVGGNGFLTCQQQADGCLKWSKTINYCASGKYCSDGNCVAENSVAVPVCTRLGTTLCTGSAIVSGGEVVGCNGGTVCSYGCSNNACNPAPVTPTPASTCQSENICLDDYSYERTRTDCSTKVYDCTSGTKCKNGACVEIPVVPPIVIAGKCDGIVCNDFCSATYDWNSNGVCNSDSGLCEYNIETLSSKCLPAQNELTGAVVVEARPQAEKTWVEKYGIIILGVIIAGLVTMYIQMSTKKKSRGKRK